MTCSFLKGPFPRVHSAAKWAIPTWSPSDECPSRLRHPIWAQRTHLKVKWLFYFIYKCFLVDTTAAGSGNLEIVINGGRVACRVHGTTPRHFWLSSHPSKKCGTLWRCGQDFINFLSFFKQKRCPRSARPSINYINKFKNISYFFAK